MASTPAVNQSPAFRPVAFMDDRVPKTFAVVPALIQLSSGRGDHERKETGGLKGYA